MAHRAARHAPLAELQRQATTDYLTGLPNRASFMAQLNETLRDPPGSAALGVAMFDLDGFKQVNDTFGHHTGDEVLHAVGARMLAALRVGDTLGRLGGDEFALLIQANSREEVRLRVEGVLDAIARRPIIVDGISHALASTAGLAFHDTDTRTTHPTEPRPENSAQLIARADTALIRGKRREKGRVWVEGEVTMPTLFR
ncbi:GGDEF domain-containing protein [Deinococcus aquaticus]|uniref:GGDEF domain-containing protein n=1 Tax=Deinococcus aquaticus TaxID=328692 RepID=UPI00361ECCA7